jgi:hypothetical protein
MQPTVQEREIRPKSQGDHGGSRKGKPDHDTEEKRKKRILPSRGPSAAAAAALEYGESRLGGR